MTRTDLLLFHAELCQKAIELMEKKNADYAAEGDPFRNFRMFGPYGILVRQSDKLSRLRSYVEKGHFDVEDEGLEDTVLDMINYAILFLAMTREIPT